jgi:AraC-like DNA-binding protein
MVVSLKRGMSVTISTATARPHAPLRRWIGGYSGSHLDGFERGSHRALPSSAVVMVLGLADPIDISGAGAVSGSFTTLVAGLRTSAAEIAHEGQAFDVSVAMTPAGARAMLGVQAGELSQSVVDLRDLWGRKAVEVIDRLVAAPTWPDRFGVIEETLIRRVGDTEQPPGALELAWDMLVSSGGRMAISDLAREVGYSRRHLHHRFTSDYGVSPKEASRLVRFQKSVGLLRNHERCHRRGLTAGRAGTLSDVAVGTGFYDQAHMTREWKELAGCPPSTWLAEEELPFVQDVASPDVENG